MLIKYDINSAEKTFYFSLILFLDHKNLIGIKNVLVKPQTNI
jgi:hypothetical protein